MGEWGGWYGRGTKAQHFHIERAELSSIVLVDSITCNWLIADSSWTPQGFWSYTISSSRAISTSFLKRYDSDNYPGNPVNPKKISLIFMIAMKPDGSITSWYSLKRRENPSRVFSLSLFAERMSLTVLYVTVLAKYDSKFPVIRLLLWQDPGNKGQPL